jgi:hypothetical protein
MSIKSVVTVGLKRLLGLLFWALFSSASYANVTYTYLSRNLTNFEETSGLWGRPGYQFLTGFAPTIEWFALRFTLTDAVAQSLTGQRTLLTDWVSFTAYDNGQIGAPVEATKFWGSNISLAVDAGGIPIEWAIQAAERDANGYVDQRYASVRTLTWDGWNPYDDYKSFTQGENTAHPYSMLYYNKTNDWANYGHGPSGTPGEWIVAPDLFAHSVPEPQPYAMILIGLFALGGTAIHRRLKLKRNGLSHS